MALVPLVSCGSGHCPTVYAAEDGDLVVQGYEIIEPQIVGGLPHGERAVKIPRQLLDDYARLTAER
jgi:hypothetical protein